MGENVSSAASVNDAFEGHRSLPFDLSKMSPPRGRGRQDGFAKRIAQVRFSHKRVRRGRTREDPFCKRRAWISWPRHAAHWSWLTCCLAGPSSS